MIQLSSELLSADLPAPPVLLSAAYADVTKTLSIDVAMSPEELTTFYVKAMAKAGWKPTTEKLVKIDFDQLMIFRNAAKDLATLQMQTIDGKLRATLKHETAAEFEEGLRLAKEEDAKRKTELARQKEMTGKAAEKGVEPVAIAVPSGSKTGGTHQERPRIQAPLGNRQGRRRDDSRGSDQARLEGQSRQARRRRWQPCAQEKRRLARDHRLYRHRRERCRVLDHADQREA